MTEPTPATADDTPEEIGGPQSRADRRRTAGDSTTAAPEGKPRTWGGRLREWGMVAVIALTLSFLVKSFLVQPFWIPSPSMESTLIPGDRVVVNKLPGVGTDVQRGDVVVFEDPANWLGTEGSQADVGPLKKGLQFIGLVPAGDDHLVKRVIGKGGDKVACCDARGRLTVNGTPIDETYLKAGQQPSAEKFRITVPKGKVWVMGDNRGFSADSRAHDNGTGATGAVPESKITGKVWAMLWPMDRMGTLPDVEKVFAKVPNP